jgi:hypothetical protein
MQSPSGLRLVVVPAAEVQPQAEEAMPHRTYRYVIVDADTRTLELFVGAFTVWWGLLFSLWRVGVPVKAWATVITTPVFGSPLWTLFFIAGGFFQLTAIHYKYPAWRRAASTIAVGLWVGCAVTFVEAAGVSVIGSVAVAFAVASAWIMWHGRVTA